MVGHPSADVEASGRGVDPEMLAGFEALTATLRQIDYRAGAGAVRVDAVAYLRRLVHVVGRTPPALYRRAVLALGDLAQLTTWLAIDQQDYDAARTYAGLALSSAQDGDDPALRAYVLGVLGHVHLHAERPQQALAVLAAARDLASNPRLDVDPAVRSWLWEATAEARAMAGDLPSGAVALGMSERIFDGVRSDAVPAWLGFFNSEEHLMRLKGRCLVRLGDGPAAVATLEEADARLPAHYVRERSGTLIDLAAAHLLPGRPGRPGSPAANPEAAAGAALTAWRLASRTDSVRNQRRVRELLPALDRYRHLAPTQELFAAVG
jgi:tetratricopeptide (TPR) repeat protein